MNGDIALFRSSDPLRVLLVEDDEDDFVIVRDLLRDGRRRYDLTWVPTYERGLAALQSRDHDIALVDYRLGGRTGLELIAAVTPADQAPPIVLLTGLDDELLDEQAAGVGAADYLPKLGLGVALLERTIRYVLARADTLVRAQLSEQRFRRIIEQASDALVIVEGEPATKAFVTVWNPAAAGLFGIMPAEAIGQDLATLLGNAGPHAQLGHVGVHELELERLGRSPLVVEVSSSQWPAEAGQQVCHIFRDVTDQEQRRARALGKLSQARCDLTQLRDRSRGAL